MTKMVRYMFWFAFIVSFMYQGLMLIYQSIPDESIWTTAAQTVQTENPRVFPKLDAYMHPGGPSIEGTIVLHALANLSYPVALDLFLIFCDSLFIGLICALCVILRKGLLWPLTVLGILSFQSFQSGFSLYQDLTPPSILAALLVPLLCLFTLYIFERKDNVQTWMWVLWSVALGFLAASRIDIGGLFDAALLLFMVRVVGFKKAVFLGIGAVVAFCAFDPFMWYAPITQVQGLFSALTAHYQGSSGSGGLPLHYYLLNMEHMIILPFIAMVLALVFVLCRKSIESPVPRKFLAFLLAASTLISIAFLSAHSQAVRYLMPLVFMWDILLPLFLFSLVSQTQFSFLHTSKDQIRARLLLDLMLAALMVVPLAAAFVSNLVAFQTLGLLRF